MSEDREYSFSLETTKLAVIGLGYVGLPLAVEFGKCRSVVGFDINIKRIEDLQSGKDTTLEVSNDELLEAKNLKFSSKSIDLKSCNVFIVTVPTPIDEHKRPNLEPLISASETVGKILKRGDVVIYESTVYPGATEEDCIPILEAVSTLKFNRDFFVGYSPERINPGDKAHRLTAITKVTSGSTPEAADFIDDLYGSIIGAGTHKASSIRVAEAAKVIENTQRDLNIALVNELAMIFHRLGVDTNEVLEAAGTKWNFLKFRPGLVGGHCIGVDPYYLTHKAESVGFYPQLVLAGRRVNEGVPEFVASKLVKKMVASEVALHGARVLVLGATFKENCPDTRNSLSFYLVDELKKFGFEVHLNDPWADPLLVKEHYGFDVVSDLDSGYFDAVVLAVAHREYKDLGVDGIRALLRGRTGIFFDMKGVFAPQDSDLRL